VFSSARGCPRSGQAIATQGVEWGCMARVLTNVVAFLMMVCVGIAAGCVLEAEDAFERVGKRDANKGRIQRSG